MRALKDSTYPIIVVLLLVLISCEKKTNDIIDFRESIVGSYYGEEIYRGYPPNTRHDTSMKNYLVKKAMSDSCILIIWDPEKIDFKDSCHIDVNGNAELLGSRKDHFSEYIVSFESDTLDYYWDNPTSDGSELYFVGAKTK